MGQRDPKEPLRQFLSEARSLHQDYLRDFESYRSNRELGPLLAGEAARRIFGYPAGKAERAARALQRGWEATQEYAHLEGRLRDLRLRTARFLDTLAERTSRGYARKIARRLKPVGDVVRLDTKIRKLTGILETLEVADLVYREDVPKRKQRSRPKSSPTRASSKDSGPEAIAWGLFALVATVAVGLGFGLSPALGPFSWVLGLFVGVAIAVSLMVTRKLWVPRIRRFLEGT